jgi:hypothetical protein
MNSQVKISTSHKVLEKWKPKERGPDMTDLLLMVPLK